LISVVLAILNEKFQITAIAYMMGISWGTLAGCFMGPYVLGVISKKVTKPATWASIISSLVLTVALILFFGYHKSGFDCSFGTAIKVGVSCSPMIGVICMIFSIIITVVVSLFTKKPSDEILYEAFDKPIANEIK
jgi:Na+(H+)/acetate symporter ActP